MSAVWVVRTKDGHFCYAYPNMMEAMDAAGSDDNVTRETILTSAHAAVIGTVKQFLSIYNNEKVSDPNAAAWAIGEMEAAVATLGELEGEA